MPLFSSLRPSRHSSSSDEKEHNSDGDDGGGDGIDNNVEIPPLATPLLDSESGNANDVGSANGRNGNADDDDDTFALRIKLNDGKSTIDYTLDNVELDVTVAKLKEQILSKHFHDNSGTSDMDDNNANNRNNNETNNNRYLRLIVRGRMMAPDTSPLDKFSIAENDVIHAVLAKEGVRGGQQARMLRRLNKNNNDGQGSGSSSGNGNANAANSSSSNSNGISLPTSNSQSRSQQSLWRRIGIDSNGVVIPRNNNENDESEDDDSEEESDFEDAHGEIDLEMGGGSSQRSQLQQQALEEGSRRRRRRRERRGFDRLRATGMTRDEVTAIRLYFARSVDRYIERRRVMIRASRRLRSSLTHIVNGSGVGGGTSPSSRRLRSNTGESTNSLLDTEEGDSNQNTAEGGENNANETGGENNATNNGSGSGTANNNSNNNNTENNENSTALEGEEILNDRPRMEDEWMSTQGPYSEFRMNLNTSNPLLLAAISGGGAVPGGVAGGAANTATAATNPLDRTAAGLFFRSRNNVLGGGLDDDEEMFGGAFSPNGTFIRNDANGNPRGLHGYMGPVPSPGTDKDFVWGFILGFFVGWIMIFWVWMPTVPYKQKIGIISGISFQLSLNLLRKSQGVGM
mmetsp:Transcript_30424/g.64407  ORF Transcript_30424/g.64407 Transcript_30424/m.64407 type:complete len:628 (-) Transcript_30424:2393-4276(-)|eukprot:CAMPEP_0172321808 /NCGR_PEP_ID=MMETSP1058-20130122/44344_1 /TAXON_ID=83371 /ORGANISM="Detonula confervacea, Strain CCMP 353" /LENGTH=627 /DNA_ID=CAMNT_0013037405 /DNA_START=199 /DNA_END=2082 /DNA_ORIENTATION=-